MATDTDLDFEPAEASGDAVTKFLRRALTDYSRSKSRWAFSPITLMVGHTDDLAHDLHAFLESLPLSAGERWHDALSALLRSKGAIPDEDTAILLIDLAVLAKSGQVLEILPTLAEQEWASERLLDRIVDAVLELPMQKEASLACLKAVCNLPQFPATSAGTVLVALCHIAPDDWVQHARVLAPKMRELMHGSADSEVLGHYAEGVLSEIQLERLGKDWHHLDGDGDLAWLKDGLLNSEDPAVDVDGDRLVSRMFEGESASIYWPVPNRWQKLEDSLARLTIAFDEDRHIDQAGNWRLLISGHVVHVPTELRGYSAMLTGADLLAALTNVERSTTSRWLAKRASEAFESAKRDAVGQLFLEAAKTQRDKLAHTRLSESPVELRRVVYSLKYWRVKSDGRRALSEGDFNIDMREHVVRMPTKVWIAFGKAASAETLVETMSDAGDNVISFLGWERRRFDDARARAVGKIVTTAFEVKATRTAVEG